MLISELITDNNLEEAVTLQNTIFPRENARANFEESIAARKTSPLPTKYLYEYYLVRDEKHQPVGLWGHYVTGGVKDDLWLGWYGVHPTQLHKGYGTKIFGMFEKYGRDNGFKTLRLYTDEIDNATACCLYEKLGMTKEYYNNPDDQTSDIGPILIYSKSLTKEPVQPWNNKFINYKGQREKETSGPCNHQVTTVENSRER